MSVPSPAISWAQRPHCVFLVVEAQVAKKEDVSVEFSSTSVGIRYTAPTCGTAGPSSLAVHEEKLELFDAINPAECGWHLVPGRFVQVYLKRASKGSYWPRLTKGDKKLRNVSVNWSLWRDEDEVAEEDEDKAAREFSQQCNPYTMGNGLTIGGGGDPREVAKLQAELLLKQQAKR